MNWIVTIVPKHVMVGAFEGDFGVDLELPIIPKLNKSQQQHQTKRTLKQRSKIKSLPTSIDECLEHLDEELGSPWDPQGKEHSRLGRTPCLGGWDGCLRWAFTPVRLRTPICQRQKPGEWGHGRYLGSCDQESTPHWRVRVFPAG